MVQPDLDEDLFAPLESALSRVDAAMEAAAVARVRAIDGGVATVSGFSDLRADEMLVFPGGVRGIASSAGERDAGVILLGPSGHLQPGDKVRRTGAAVATPVGEGLLGRILDGLGSPIDGGPQLRPDAFWPIERPAPPILRRAPVAEPLQTGIKAVDAAVPIGRGQRELIIGDRQTGKTTIAVDAILNQRETGVVCIYCAIGQRASAVARVIGALREGGMLERSIVVVASGEGSPGLQYVAPYAATAMAEFFMEAGRDVLIVYDDLTRHARAYRELSLLLRRPPGREAYPGDIFYIHARLLERATHLRAEHGGGSLTALPVVETQAQNLAAYIPTNLISITDGQVVLSPTLFDRGQLPAIDIGASVSRVGGKVQRPAFRAVAGNLRLMYAQFEELETFARFGTQLEPETRRKLVRGARVREVLRQSPHAPMDVAAQIAVLLAATEGLFDGLAPGTLGAAQAAVVEGARNAVPRILEDVEAGEPLGDEARGALLEAMRAALERVSWVGETATVQSGEVPRGDA